MKEKERVKGRVVKEVVKEKAEGEMTMSRQLHRRQTLQGVVEEKLLRCVRKDCVLYAYEAMAMTLIFFRRPSGIR